MNIQFVRLDEFVCEVLNQQALRQRRTVSDLVNEILRAHLEEQEKSEAAGN
jgi:hypothetical protein